MRYVTFALIILLTITAQALESHGYCVKIASSSYTAIKTLDETSVAAILLEYREEGMERKP